MLVFLVAAAVSVPAAEQSAIFTAAGFKQARGAWRTDCDQPDSDSYEPGSIETFKDLNGDGRQEALVTEGSTYCYGMTGTGFRLLTKLPTGKWKVIHQSEGMAEFLSTRGIDRMPDMSVGGPGFCFPVLRWNGKAYAQNRFEYEGKACRLPK
jgi:hypothetical protein